MEYSSYRVHTSQTCPGVRFRVRRLSLERRLELVRLIREEAIGLPFHAAGEGPEDQATAAELTVRMDALYVRWGLDGIDGLYIDGVEADTESLLSCGPDALTREVADAVRAEIFLSPEERKN